MVSVSLLALFAPLVFARDKALLLLDSKVFFRTHSYMLTNLQTQFQMTIKMADDADLQIIKYGLKMYQHIFVFAPSTEEFGGDVKSSTFSQYVEQGGNLVVVGDPEIGDAIRALGAEFGIEYDEAGTKVINHFEPEYEFSMDSGGKNTRFLLRASDVFLGQSEKIVGDKHYGGLLMDDAIAMKIDDKNNMAFPIMRCNKYCYSWFPNEKISEYPLAVGNDITLVAGIQFRNNARAMFIGSLSFMSNKILEQKMIVTFDQEKTRMDRIASSNQKFIQHTFGWVAGMSGRVRVTSIKHKLEDGDRNEFYYINERVKVQVTMEVWQEDSWEPIPPEFDDVWLEFHRLDPFIRGKLNNEGGGKLVAFVDVPDTYGVFNFIVSFNKLGYTRIEAKKQVTVRPLRHDMYERFITSAYPYYFSAFSMMFGVFLLSFAFLYHQDEKKKSD